MCVCNGTVIIQVLMAFQVLNIDLKRFVLWPGVSPLCWLSTSHVITLRTEVMEMAVLYFLGGEE